MKFKSGEKVKIILEKFFGEDDYLSVMKGSKNFKNPLLNKELTIVGIIPNTTDYQVNYDGDKYSFVDESCLISINEDKLNKLIKVGVIKNDK